MREQFVAFLQKPSKETFLAVRERVVTSAAYNPYSDDLEKLSALIAEKRYKPVLEALPPLMPGWVLSPRLHAYASIAFEGSGNKDQAKNEAMIRDACLHGILSTGDGGEAAPYLVTTPSDERDVLRAIGRRIVSQEIRHKGEAHYDVIALDGGRLVWFDVSPALRFLKQRASMKWR